MKCKHCGSERLIVPYGDFMKFGRLIIRTYKCLTCGKATSIKEKMK